MSKIYSEKIPWRPREYYILQPENLSLLERIKKHGFKARIFGSSKSKPKSSIVFSAIKKTLALGVIVVILACLYFLIFW